MIDFHCHLDLYPEPHKIISEIERRGMYVLAVTTTPKAWKGNIKIVGDSRRIRVGVGLHPELVGKRFSEIALLEHLIADTKYVGEIGLDGSPAHEKTLDLQKVVFSRALRASAAHGGKIISIHSRGAVNEVLDALEAEPTAGTPVLHWFSGTPRQLDRAISLGCWFSVGPAMLGSSKGQALLARMPRDRILTETDAPFTSVRGRTLMPWDVEQTMPTLASSWEISEAQASCLVMENLRTLLI